MTVFYHMTIFYQYVFYQNLCIFSHKIQSYQRKYQTSGSEILTPKRVL